MKLTKPMNATTETTPQTLSGEEVPTEDDRHNHETKDKQNDDNTIYPIETTFSLQMSFDTPGKNPYYPNISVKIPFSVKNIPSTRVNEAREDIKQKIDYSQPEIGELGTITFTEETHHIKFYPEDEKHTITLGEWIFEQFYHFLNHANEKAFNKSPISHETVSTIQELTIENLPGRFITVGGECEFCNAQIKKTRYISDPTKTEAGAICNECNTGTVYPEL